MQHRLVASEIAAGRHGPITLAAVAIAWIVLGFASLSGLGAWLGHGRLIAGGLPMDVVLPLFLGGWLVMLIAMMLPTLPRPGRAPAGFVVGFRRQRRLLLGAHADRLRGRHDPDGLDGGPDAGDGR